MELLLRYSNKSALLPHLADVVRQVRECDATDLPGVCDLPQAGQATDRLTMEDAAKLVVAFQAGTAKHQLAARFGISESTVKRVLRAHGVRALWSLEERLTEQQAQRLIWDYLAGTTMPQLVRKYGGSSSSIRRLLVRRGIRRA